MMMTRFLIAAAIVTVASPAMAFNLGCWDTQDIVPNAAIEGTYLNQGNASVDYVWPENEGADALLAGLPAFDGASFIICMAGHSIDVDGDDVWQMSEAIICPSSEFTGGACPE